MLLPLGIHRHEPRGLAVESHDHQAVPRALHDTTLTTDTKRVARHFKKLHKNVLRAYDNLDCSEEFRRLNFEPTSEFVMGPHGASRPERVVRMTKNGFMFPPTARDRRPGEG